MNNLKVFEYKDKYIVFPIHNQENRIGLEVSKDGLEIIYDVENGLNKSDIIAKYADKFSSIDEAEREIGLFLDKVLYKPLMDQNKSKDFKTLSMLSKLAIDRFQAKRPYKVFIELTHCCNLRCPHCYLQDELVTYTDFPNKEDIFKLLNKLEEMGVVLVTFTGGECTLHPNFYEIIEYACSKNLLVSILTNSLLLKEADIIKLSKLPIYDIRVSIYGNEEVHDNFVKCKGAYQKVLNNLELMKKYMNNGAASFVITNTNYYTFDDVVSTMKQKGIRLYFSPNIMPTTTGGNQPTQLRLDKDKIKELYSKIPNFSKIGSKCSAGISRFRITPEGILNPCEMIRDISFGNVSYNGIEKCLLSSNRKQWVLLMEDLYKNHSCMNCKGNLYCTICPGVFKLETGSFYGHSEFSCMMAKIKGEMVNAKE